MEDALAGRKPFWSAAGSDSATPLSMACCTLDNLTVRIGGFCEKRAGFVVPTSSAKAVWR
jgi:hypothetical protein